MIDWAELDNHKFSDENIAASSLLPRIHLKSPQKENIDCEAVDIVRRARAMTAKKGSWRPFWKNLGFLTMKA